MEEDNPYGARARRLQKHLSDKHQLTFPLGQVYEMIAAEEDSRSWNVLSAKIKAATGMKPTLPAEAEPSAGPFLEIPTGRGRPSVEVCRRSAMFLCDPVMWRHNIAGEMIRGIAQWSPFEITELMCERLEIVMMSIVKREKGDVVELVEALLGHVPDGVSHPMGKVIASLWTNYPDDTMSAEDSLIRARMEAAVKGSAVAETVRVELAPGAQWNDTIARSVQAHLGLKETIPWAERHTTEGRAQIQADMPYLIKALRRNKILIVQYLLAWFDYEQPERRDLVNAAQAALKASYGYSSHDGAFYGIVTSWDYLEAQPIRDLSTSLCMTCMLPADHSDQSLRERLSEKQCHSLNEWSKEHTWLGRQRDLMEWPEWKMVARRRLELLAGLAEPERFRGAFEPANPIPQ